MAQAPIVSGEGSTHLRFRINDSLADSLDELAAKRQESRSALIREAVQLLVEQQEVVEAS